jgi:hypothetical protein
MIGIAQYGIMWAGEGLSMGVPFQWSQVEYKRGIGDCPLNA